MTGSTVIVGAGGGIGSAIATDLLGREWAGPLVLADVQLDKVDELADGLRARGGIVSTRTVDVGSTASIDELVAATTDVRRVAIVSGIFGARSSLDVDRDDFERILHINLMGPFFVAQAFARQMLDRDGGSIVGVASIAARMPRMRQAAYSASKAGMRQALRVLAMETVRGGVRINTVSPGPTDTPMMRDLAKDHPLSDLAAGSPEAFRPAIPRGHVGRPEEIAAAVSFLLSPEASHIVMQDLLVDGGETLGL